MIIATTISLAEIVWSMKNVELSSQLVGQQWVKSLKGLIQRPMLKMTLYACLTSLNFRIWYCAITSLNP